jgi:hypothetical protein
MGIEQTRCAAAQNEGVDLRNPVARSKNPVSEPPDGPEEDLP